MASTEKDYKQRRLGGGKLHIAEFDALGVLGEEEWFGITDNLVQTIEQEFVEIDNTESCTSFTDTKVVSKTTVTLTWESKNVSPVNMTRAFLGEKTETDHIAVTGKATNINVVALDTPYTFEDKFTSNVEVKDDTDTTTYVEGTDYSISTTVEPNTITAISGGAISAGDTVHVTYDVSAYTSGLIKALVKGILSAQLRFDMCNSQGYDYTITYHKGDISSAGDFSLKAVEDAGILTFSASITKLESKDNLFEISYEEKTV